MDERYSGETLADLRGVLAARDRRGPKLAYTVEEAADALGIGWTRLFEAIAAGRLLAVKFGRRTLVPVEDARAFLPSLDQA